MKTISIIGAGIGGLTTGIVLKKHGIEPVIYESAPEIKPVGAGIMMANNAMQVFQRLGLRDEIEAGGNYISHMRITDSQLRDISVVSFKTFEEKYGVKNVAIHRGVLQNILADKFGRQQIILNKRLERAEKDESKIKLFFQDKIQINTDAVIGADGIKSVVREDLITKGTIRDAGQDCWRGLCEYKLPAEFNHAGVECWGRGRRFGFTRIDDKRVYWYAVISRHLKESSLTEMFSDFHEEILNLINATPQSQIIESSIADLKPIKVWQKQNVCLIGDAAHATTPNMGQGACQAVEDSYVLDKLLDQGISLPKIFLSYQNIRRKKAHFIVNSSRTLGTISHWENPLLIGLRNGLMRFTSDMNKKQLEEVFELTRV